MTAASSPAEWEAKCRELLAETYTPQGVDAYMNAKVRGLSSVWSPSELIAMGEGSRVWRAVEWIEFGA